MLQLFLAGMVDVAADLLDAILFLFVIVENVKTFKERIAVAGADGSQLDAMEDGRRIFFGNIETGTGLDFLHD